jgi:hypothetical protein
MMSESGRWLDYSKHPMPTTLSWIAAFSIQLAMKKFLWAILIVGCVIVGSVQAQVAVPATSDAGQQPTAAVADDLSLALATPSESKPHGKVGLVRGVLKRADPIHDQLLIHAFGGGDVRIAFDPRTQFLPENTRTHLTSIPAGSVVSVDTVVDGGKLFALSVRTGPSNAAELNGQVVRYDAAKSQLTLRDPVSPEDVSLGITPNTIVVNRGKPVLPQALSPGMLVRVLFSPTQHAANNVEILAERGGSFPFEGRIVAIDLRSRVLALLNDSDQSVRELAIGLLDPSSLRLLREGADVNIQAEFDGDRYNVRTVTLVSRNP